MITEKEKHKQDKQVVKGMKVLAKSEPTSPKKTTEEEKITPDEVTEVMDSMPPEVKRSFQAFMAMFTRSSGPRPNPLFEKFTESHIDKYLDMVRSDDEHEYMLRSTNRWFYLLYAVLVLVIFIIGIVYLLPRDKDLLVQLITLIVILGGGIGGGYGLSKRHSQ
jgi:hypothetical protein